MGKRRWIIGLAFALPALVVLGAFVLYPALRTIYDSFFDRFGEEYVGFANYRDMFRFDRMRRAIINSAVWTALFPILVTSIGLVLAVLAEKIRWKTAFKLVLFLPLAIAVMSSGIIWRLVYDQSPDRGLLNAVINVPVEVLNPAGNLHGAAPSTDDVVTKSGGGMAASVNAENGGATVLIGVVRIGLDDVPEGAVEAVPPPDPQSGEIVGVVWRDTKPGENESGVVEADELGLPDVPMRLVDSSGSTIDRATSAPDGSFAFTGVTPGTYTVEVSESEFREAWGGIQWLGPTLVTPAAIIAGAWIWAGFALVVIGAGLASLSRDVLEAARVDGASDWQVFRHVTVPLLAPVLGVVFVTLTINALKMFDLIVGIAPGSVQDEANVIALEMWRTAFTGLGNRGLGSAIAVFLFILIIPVMVLNLRRFRLEEENR